MPAEDFNHTIDTWIKELEKYSYIQLSAKLSPHSWSLGQLYLHLITETGYYIEQAKICASGNDNAIEEASPAAKMMFLNNSFPDEDIKGPPSNSRISQPESKEQLMNGLLTVKDKMANAEMLISKSQFKGKTKHPGLNYFSAAEWLQFAQMHFRHHLRQKKKIDNFLTVKI